MRESLEVMDRTVPWERLSSQDDGSLKLHGKVVPTPLVFRAMANAAKWGGKIFRHGRVSLQVEPSLETLPEFIFNQGGALRCIRSSTAQEYAVRAVRAYMRLARTAGYQSFDALLEAVPMATGMLKRKRLRQAILSAVTQGSLEAADLPVAAELERFVRQFQQWKTGDFDNLPRQRKDLLDRLYRGPGGRMKWAVRPFRRRGMASITEIQVILGRLVKLSEDGTEWELRDEPEDIDVLWRIVRMADGRRVRTVLHAEHDIDVPEALKAQRGLADKQWNAVWMALTLRFEKAEAEAMEAGRYFARLVQALGPAYQRVWPHLYFPHWKMLNMGAFVTGFAEVARREIVDDLLRVMAIHKA